MHCCVVDHKVVTLARFFYFKVVFFLWGKNVYIGLSAGTIGLMSISVSKHVCMYLCMYYYYLLFFTPGQSHVFGKFILKAYHYYKIINLDKALLDKNINFNLFCPMCNLTYNVINILVTKLSI